ncbi:LysR substrate-binding domain-containing protein [Actibacterium mucosum]|uniref:LysR substrate-binding domain-containing protein n=1 Tax=Actibacterium mucosum TaxID=1087332 RepID=UPI0038994782
MSPALFRAFRHAFPRIELRLHEMTIAEQLVALENGQIDLGILRARRLPAPRSRPPCCKAKTSWLRCRATTPWPHVPASH